MEFLLGQFGVRHLSPMTKRIAIYARCSIADDQTTENQIHELRATAERHGWAVVAVFHDQGVSGSLARERRPAMKALLRAVTRREVDMVAAWAVDRLGRSLVAWRQKGQHRSCASRSGRRYCAARGLTSGRATAVLTGVARLCRCRRRVQLPPAAADGEASVVC